MDRFEQRDDTPGVGRDAGAGRDVSAGRLLFAGDVYCDLVFSDVEPPAQGTEVLASGFGIHPGGVANRAIAAARAGARSVLLSRLGDDAIGTHVTALLRDEPRLDTSLLQLVPGLQSPITVAMTSGADRSFLTYLESRAEVAPPSDLTVDAAHLSVADPLPVWAGELRARGTELVGGVGWDASGTWSPDVLERLGEIDVFVPNDVEAMHYTRTTSVTEAAQVLAQHVPLVVVTCGDRGAYAIDAAHGRELWTPAPQVHAVDPTGAGDVFVASFMAARQRPWSLDQQLQYAALAASVSVTRPGGATSAPTREELLHSAQSLEQDQDWSFLLAPSDAPHPTGATDTPNSSMSSVPTSHTTSSTAARPTVHA
jgi:sugar/nucleoside kinase (ribokinase family)